MRLKLPRSMISSLVSIYRNVESASKVDFSGVTFVSGIRYRDRTIDRAHNAIASLYKEIEWEYSFYPREKDIDQVAYLIHKMYHAYYDNPTSKLPPIYKWMLNVMDTWEVAK